jgi:hypothetical protein
MKKLSLPKIAVSLFLIFASINLVRSQDIGSLEYWLKIKPFIDTKEEVEKMFSKGTATLNYKYLVSYPTSYGDVSVQYSPGSCTYAVDKKVKIPEWTVIDVTYNTDDGPPKLKKLLTALGTYKTKQEGDVIDHISYYNREKGISIIYDSNIKDVIEVHILPTPNQEKQSSCE